MNKKPVENFKITDEGKKYIKRLKAMAAIRNLFAMKKKQVDAQSSVLSMALDETHKGILQATQIPGDNLMYNISQQEE